MVTKRVILIVISLGLMLALVTACAGAPASGTGAAAVEQPEAAVEAPAPVTEISKEEVMAEGVEVTYTYAGRGVPTDLQLVQDALNEIITPKIGVKLILEPIDFGAYNDKMQLRLSAGEECDIIFTAPWINSYPNNVANGVLLPLDDLLPKFAPGLWASMPPSTWEAARVNGNIYAVINQQIFPKPWGVHVRKDLLEKYNFSLDEVKRWEDMEPFLAAARDGEGITPVFGDNLWRPQYWGYDPLDDGIASIGMKAADEGLTVVGFLDTPEFKASADLTKHWVDEGFLPLEPLPADEGQAAFRAGQFAMGYHVEKPGNDVEAKNQYGWDFVSKNLTDPLILDTAGAIATLNAICATSKQPEEAMKVLELFNTDVDVYNLLSRGIEDKHWVWVDEEKQVMGFPEGVNGDTSPYNPNTDWMFGNQFNAYYRDEAQVGAWEKTKVMNDTAFPSKALGFVVDRGPIETEVAQTNAVWKELVEPIMNGYVAYDEAGAEAMAKLKEAGIDKIVEEVGRQLQEWKAANQ